MPLTANLFVYQALVRNSGVDATGALILKQHDKLIAVHAGDVSLRVQL
jgi:hypothetical protein